MEAVTMFVRLFALLVGVLFISMPTGPSIQDPVPIEKPSEEISGKLREGTWIHRGFKNIMGAGTDDEITFRLMRVRDRMLENHRTFAGWTVTYMQIEYFRVGSKKDPKITTTGPFPVEVDEAQSILTIKNKDPRSSRYTFSFSEDGSTLTMPAFVEVEPGHFLYVNEGKSFEVKCENDPRKIPVGKVWMSVLNTGQLYYSYEEMPRFLDWTNDKSVRYLRILERIKGSGHLIERGRLIWDDMGSPRYEQILSTGQPRSHKQQIKTWYAK